MEGRFDWGRYDFGTFRRRDIFTMGRCDCKASAHARNYVSLERCRNSFTAVVLGDHDIPLTASNFGNLTAFRAILDTFSL